MDDLDFGKKKKKKKAKAEGDDGAAAGEEAAPTGEGDELDELKLKKKKKKKAVLDGEGGDDAGAGGEEGAGEGEGEGDAGGDFGGGSGLPWAGSSRDYHYEELLGRVFGILRENNPELSGEKHKTILKPPQVLREGTKKTVFVNFNDLCKAMHRPPEHVITYLLTELGTNGNLDGQMRLIVKGRFLPKVFEGILRRYINDYVICNMCKSADTLLHKENRLFMLRCQAVRRPGPAPRTPHAVHSPRVCAPPPVRRVAQRVRHQERLRSTRWPPQAHWLNHDGRRGAPHSSSRRPACSGISRTHCRPLPSPAPR